MSTGDLPPDRSSNDLPKAMGRPANAALVANGITTLDQVAGMTKRDLLSLHGVGPKAVRILEAELEASGRSLAI